LQASATLATLPRVTGRVPRESYPWWVKVSLWGVPGRVGLWSFVAISILAAAASIMYGFRDPRFFAGGALMLAALPYWRSIRWIDKHGSWDE
jgi:hypothetical protein